MILLVCSFLSLTDLANFCWWPSNSIRQCYCYRDSVYLGKPGQCHHHYQRHAGQRGIHVSFVIYRLCCCVFSESHLSEKLPSLCVIFFVFTNGQLFSCSLIDCPATAYPLLLSGWQSSSSSAVPLLSGAVSTTLFATDDILLCALDADFLNTTVQGVRNKGVSRFVRVYSKICMYIVTISSFVCMQQGGG